MTTPAIQTLDKLFDAEKRAFKYARRVETQYAVALRSLASQIGAIVRHYHDETALGAAYIRAHLARYADLIDPWAHSVAHKMVSETAARDRAQWARISSSMRRNLIQQIDKAPIGPAFADLMQQQVGLIKSLPLDAAQDVQDMMIQNLSNGARPAGNVPQIADLLRSRNEGFANEVEEKVRNRANLIARTESTRAATTLLEARSEYIGADQYIWHTSHDADVREDHRILDGKAFYWRDPPIADRRSGTRANPGCIWRCRCWAEPIIVDAQ